jgi:hypothetical protein
VDCLRRNPIILVFIFLLCHPAYAPFLIITPQFSLTAVFRCFVRPLKRRFYFRRLHADYSKIACVSDLFFRTPATNLFKSSVLNFNFNLRQQSLLILYVFYYIHLCKILSTFLSIIFANLSTILAIKAAMPSLYHFFCLERTRACFFLHFSIMQVDCLPRPLRHFAALRATSAQGMDIRKAASCQRLSHPKRRGKITY